MTHLAAIFLPKHSWLGISLRFTWKGHCSALSNNLIAWPYHKLWRCYDVRGENKLLRKKHSLQLYVIYKTGKGLQLLLFVPENIISDLFKKDTFSKDRKSSHKLCKSQRNSIFENKIQSCAKIQFR